jgi:hypothetical protein
MRASSCLEAGFTPVFDSVPVDKLLHCSRKSHPTLLATLLQADGHDLLFDIQRPSVTPFNSARAITPVKYLSWSLRLVVNMRDDP